MEDKGPAPPVISVIGLGYVGLPLAVEFARQRPVIGFDIDSSRIAALREGHDATREVAPEEFAVYRGTVLRQRVALVMPPF